MRRSLIRINELKLNPNEKSLEKYIQGNENISFETMTEMLEMGLALLRCREDIDNMRIDDDCDVQEKKQLVKKERVLNRIWHRKCKVTNSAVFLCENFNRCRLNRLEREIVIYLLLSNLRLFDLNSYGTPSIGKLIVKMNLPLTKRIAAIQSFGKTQKLIKHGFVICNDDEDDYGLERDIMLNPIIVDRTIDPDDKNNGWKFKKEADFYNKLGSLVSVIKRKSDEGDLFSWRYSGDKDYKKASSSLEYLLFRLRESLREHPAWPITKLSCILKQDIDYIIFLALLGKEVGLGKDDRDLYKGKGLAIAAGDDPKDIVETLKHLTSKSLLVKKKIIQPSGGLESLISDDPGTLSETEFELTLNVLLTLGQGRKKSIRLDEDVTVRKPATGFKDLAIHEEGMNAIRMGLNHLHGAKTILHDWGLGQKIGYGRGVTMIFHGPPGTGKTATAEAIARELNKPLLVADYSKIQNCFVGQTEKNIVRTFYQAKEHEAVLFWDEADAMFFDRDSADRNWEVRDINVLLQQIERFEGVCILATNRLGTLDKALERRITAKVEFPRPDRAMREMIWKKMLPKKMPLGNDVDLRELSETDLSGGEIKNVVLNAARIAFSRTPEGPVSAIDFYKAIEMETRGSWSKQQRNPIGFMGKQ